MNAKNLNLMAWLLLGLAAAGCSRKLSLTEMHVGYSLLSDEIKNELKDVERSIVHISTKVQYRVETFHYLLQNGTLVADPRSPLRYKLDPNVGRNGITTEPDKKTLSGGGLILRVGHEPNRYTILTSSHLVSPDDTTDVYYLDEDGNETDILYARYIVTRTDIWVRGKSNWRAAATLLADDPTDDLAIIVSTTNNALGPAFKNPLGYDANLGWGDWVFLFGFPRGVKQMTGGWVSESPYRGTLAVDAVVRFGFSGGPVFSISRKDGKLAFVGLIKSVPRSTFDYIGYEGTLPVGSQLTVADLDKLVLRRQLLVEYGTAYFVAPKTIKQFMQLARAPLENANIKLDERYFE
ncbi:MAG: serine protease [Calditrichaeota bacterium]|nr:MAG: serine protease [Calditrichota bacterium]